MQNSWQSKSGTGNEVSLGQVVYQQSEMERFYRKGGFKYRRAG